MALMGTKRMAGVFLFKESTLVVVVGDMTCCGPSSQSWV